MGKKISRSFKYDKNMKHRLYELNSIINGTTAGNIRLAREEKERIKSGQTWNKKLGREINRSFKYNKNTKNELYRINAQIEAALRLGQQPPDNLLRRKADLKGETWNRKLKVGLDAELIKARSSIIATGKSFIENIKNVGNHFFPNLSPMETLESAQRNLIGLKTQVVAKIREYPQIAPLADLIESVERFINSLKNELINEVKDETAYSLTIKLIKFVPFIVLMTGIIYVRFGFRSLYIPVIIGTSSVYVANKLLGYLVRILKCLYAYVSQPLRLLVTSDGIDIGVIFGLGFKLLTHSVTYMLMDVNTVQPTEFMEKWGSEIRDKCGEDAYGAHWSDELPAMTNEEITQNMNRVFQQHDQLPAVSLLGNVVGIAHLFVTSAVEQPDQYAGYENYEFPEENPVGTVIVNHGKMYEYKNKRWQQLGSLPLDTPKEKKGPINYRKILYTLKRDIAFNGKKTLVQKEPKNFRNGVLPSRFIEPHYNRSIGSLLSQGIIPTNNNGNPLTNENGNPLDWNAVRQNRRDAIRRGMKAASPKEKAMYALWNQRRHTLSNNNRRIIRRTINGRANRLLAQIGNFYPGTHVKLKRGSRDINKCLGSPSENRIGVVTGKNVGFGWGTPTFIVQCGPNESSEYYAVDLEVAN